MSNKVADAASIARHALAMIGAVAALAGVVREAALLGAGVERADGVGRERPEAHGRDVEHRGRVGLGAVRSADRNPERLLGERTRRNRMVHPLVAVAVDFEMRAEWPDVELHLGALVDD